MDQVPLGKSKFVPTKEELGTFQNAMKDPKFRELFTDYMEELRDPKRRAELDKELEKMEAQGQGPADRKLMRPKARWALSLAVSNGKGQLLINICEGELCKDAKLGSVSMPKPDSTGKFRPGMNWQIPYILGHLRSAEHPTTKEMSMVYDVAFSKNTIDTAGVDDKFKSLVNKTAIEGVEGLLEGCTFVDLAKSDTLEPFDEPALMSVNVKTVEANDPNKGSMPSFGPRSKSMPNPPGIVCPDFYLRMESHEGGKRMVVLSVHMPKANVKQTDIKVEPASRDVLIEFKKQYRLDLRMAFPLDPKYQVKWQAKKERLKLTFEIPNDFDGDRQKYIPRAGEPQPAPPPAPKPRPASDNHLSHLSPELVKTKLSHKPWHKKPIVKAVGDDVTVLLTHAGIVKDSVEAIERGDKVVITFFTKRRDGVFHTSVDRKRWSLDVNGVKVNTSNENTVLRFPKTFCQE